MRVTGFWEVKESIHSSTAKPCPRMPRREDHMDTIGLSAAGEELRMARNLVESAGLTYITEPYIGDVAREIRESC